jgi:lysophospholipase L1-like esterase
MKTILCYGDSNTFGFNPATQARFLYADRWTGVLARELGSDYRVIEEGLGGRTTGWDDPILESRNGRNYLLPCL